MIFSELQFRASRFKSQKILKDYLKDFKSLYFEESLSNAFLAKLKQFEMSRLLRGEAESMWLPGRHRHAELLPLSSVHERKAADQTQSSDIKNH